jgi:hypothetical protein
VKKALAPCLVVLAGCIAANGGGGGSSGSAGSSTSGSSASDGGVDGDSAISNGLACITQTTSGLSLCEHVAACPALTVNASTFPECGFLQSGSQFELLCECSGYLCSAGTLSSCSAAASVLASDNGIAICNQVSAGTCTLEGTTVGGGVSSSCSATCEQTCVGDPACITACGC